MYFLLLLTAPFALMAFSGALPGLLVWQHLMARGGLAADPFIAWALVLMVVGGCWTLLLLGTLNLLGRQGSPFYDGWFAGRRRKAMAAIYVPSLLFLLLWGGRPMEVIDAAVLLASHRIHGVATITSVDRPVRKRPTRHDYAVSIEGRSTPIAGSFHARKLRRPGESTAVLFARDRPQFMLVTGDRETRRDWVSRLLFPIGFIGLGTWWALTTLLGRWNKRILAPSNVDGELGLVLPEDEGGKSQPVV